MADSVKIIAPSGGDYTSLSAWEAGEQAAGFTGVDNVVAEIQGDWSGGNDTTAITIAGWTGNTTAHRFILRCNAANYFDGAWDESKYILRVSGTCLRTDEDWVEVKGLQIDGVGSAATVRPQIGVASTDTVWFDDCVIRQRAATTAAVLSTTSSTVQAVFRNSLIIHLRTSSGAIYADGSGGVCRWKFYNCTLVHKGGTGASGVAFAFEAGNNNQAAIVRNCAIVGCASITTGGNGLSTTCNYNITDHPSTATGGANDQTGVDFSSTFTDPSNDDYTLQASDAVLKDQGEDLSGVDSGFSDDVHGQTRSGSWDVGFDEVVSSGTLQELAAQVDGDSTFTASLRLSKPLAGSVAGVSAFAGALSLTKPLASATAGTTVVTASLRVRKLLSSTITGATTNSGSLDLVKPLAAVFSGSTVFEADLSNTPIRRLAAIISGSSTVIASLSVRKPLAASTAGSSEIEAALLLVKILSASNAGSTSLTAALRVLRTLSATMAGSTTLLASLRSRKRLSASFNGVTTLTGTLGGSVILEPYNLDVNVIPELFEVNVTQGLFDADIV